MSEYKLKTGKIGDAVVGTYKKVENAFVDTFLEKSEDNTSISGLKTGKVGDAVVDAYKAVEDAVVGGYKKVEGAFVDAFLEKDERHDEEKQAPEQSE